MIRNFLAALAASAVLLGGALSAPAALAGQADASVETTEEGALLGIHAQGDPDAPVTIIEYLSLTCPHCANWHETVYPEVKEELIDTGKAKLELREVYFDRFGLFAGMMARCAGDPKRYFGFMDLILEKQDQWTRAENPLEALQRLGRQGGLTDDRIEACLTDRDFQKTLVEMYAGYREDPRLTGTPTLIVGEDKIENPTFENIAAAVEAEMD